MQRQRRTETEGRLDQSAHGGQRIGLRPMVVFPHDHSQINNNMPKSVQTLTEDSVLDCVLSVLSTLNWTCTGRAKRGLWCTFLGSAAPAQRGGSRAGSTQAQASKAPRPAHLLRVLGPNVGHYALHQAHKHPLRGMGRKMHQARSGSVQQQKYSSRRAAANTLHHWRH